jgi:hypothetical protein
MSQLEYKFNKSKDLVYLIYCYIHGESKTNWYAVVFNTFVAGVAGVFFMFIYTYIYTYTHTHIYIRIYEFITWFNSDKNTTKPIILMFFKTFCWVIWLKLKMAVWYRSQIQKLRNSGNCRLLNNIYWINNMLWINAMLVFITVRGTQEEEATQRH